MIQSFISFFASARGVDVFWSPLAVSVIAAVIIALLYRDKSTSNKKQGERSSLTLSEVRALIREELSNRRSNTTVLSPNKNIETSERRPVRSRSVRSGDEEGPMAIFIVGLGMLTVGFAKYRLEVLNYSVIFATSLFGFWLATIVFAQIKGVISGRGWTIYAITVCFLTLLALPMLYLSTSPMYSPERLGELESVAKSAGLIGIITELGLEVIMFVIFQVFGFIVLYGSWLYILLTLIYMASATMVVAGFKGSALWLWLTRRTSKFANPVRATVVVAILYIVSFFMISGLACKWWLSINSIQ